MICDLLLHHKAVFSLSFHCRSFKQGQKNKLKSNLHNNCRNQRGRKKKVALSNSYVSCGAVVNSLNAELSLVSHFQSPTYRACGLGSMTFFSLLHIIVTHVRDVFCPFLFIGPCLNEHFSLSTNIYTTSCYADERSLLLPITLNPRLPPRQV